MQAAGTFRAKLPAGAARDPVRGVPGVHAAAAPARLLKCAQWHPDF